MRPVKRQKPLPMPIDSLTPTQRSIADDCIHGLKKQKSRIKTQMLESNPGTGKTHICGDVMSQFVKERKKSCVFFVGESKALLQKHMNTIGCDEIVTPSILKSK